MEALPSRFTIISKSMETQVLFPEPNGNKNSVVMTPYTPGPTCNKIIVFLKRVKETPVMSISRSGVSLVPRLSKIIQVHLGSGPH